MAIQEVEVECAASQRGNFPRHELQTAELPIEKTFFPHGFPIEIRTNCAEVLDMLGESWGRFEQQHDTEPVRAEVHVVKSDSTECPPEPAYRITLPLFTATADADNYTIVDFERHAAKVSLSQAALRHRLYAGYFLMGPLVTCIATRYVTPVHAGCVSLDGCGVLLCGDSGAGKSTLSYACARKGWTYISDDASFLLNGDPRRRVTGNCHQVRFRPTAADLFPEISGLEITPRAAGKPSVEMPTAMIPNLVCTHEAHVDHIVFLNRNDAGPPRLEPYSKDAARYFMRQALYGLPETMAVQYETIERLLTADVFELRYRDLDWAIDRLRTLVREGQ